jgi:hypothetical protein
MTFHIKTHVPSLRISSACLVKFILKKLLRIKVLERERYFMLSIHFLYVLVFLIYLIKMVLTWHNF